MSGKGYYKQCKILPRLNRLNNGSKMTPTLQVQPKDSALLLTKSAMGHNPDSPSTLTTYFRFHLNVVLPSPSWSSNWFTSKSLYEFLYSITIFQSTLFSDICNIHSSLWSRRPYFMTIQDSQIIVFLYEGHLQILWTHLMTPSRNSGGVVTVSFSKYLPRQAMLHSLLKNVVQTVDHFKISCLGAPFSWLEKPRNWVGRDLNWILCSVWKKWIGRTPLEHLPYSPDLTPHNFWAFPTMKRELQGKKVWSDQRSTAHFWEWVEHCKERITFQGKYFIKETVTTPPQSSYSE
jgi:hypothetical protein